MSRVNENNFRLYAEEVFDKCEMHRHVGTGAAICMKFTEASAD
jgi:hypothetical protein